MKIVESPFALVLLFSILINATLLAQNDSSLPEVVAVRTTGERTEQGYQLFANFGSNSISGRGEHIQSFSDSFRTEHLRVCRNPITAIYIPIPTSTGVI